MFKLPGKLNKCLGAPIARYLSESAVATEKEIEFKPLNLRQTKGPVITKRTPRKIMVAPPRTEQMAVDQDWGNVWPGPKTFHPASVPLPIRQGYAEKMTIPGKYGNAELMKIPNFLHLTPPVIKRQCEALKQFCTPWPKALDTDEKCEKHFPLEIASSSYCHSSPSIRDPLSRIVTVKLRVSALKLDEHARDKFLRLVGDRYDEKTDILTLVTDRCPLKKQNYEYAMYLITALYHESMNVEEWEKLKSEADMEFYDWNASKSKSNVEKIFGQKSESIENIDSYSDAVDKLMNDGENEYNLTRYRESVKTLLNVPDIS